MGVMAGHQGSLFRDDYVWRFLDFDGLRGDNDVMSVSDGKTCLCTLPYCLPSLNEVLFISHKQTLSLVMGSCVSTVFIGRRGDRYILGANHIVIASPRKKSVVATRSAREQVEDIRRVLQEEFAVADRDMLCLHLIGGGSRDAKTALTVPLRNIAETGHILEGMNHPPLFRDVGSYHYSTYSLYENRLSLFIENKMSQLHKSFIMDLDRLFEISWKGVSVFPASALEAQDRGFEYLAEQGIIVFITGEKGFLTDAGREF